MYSSEAQGQVVVHLPYGTYTIAFEADWYQPCRRQVVIDSPVAFIELAALFIAPEENYHRGSISVKVDRGTSCNPEGALWAKLVGVYVHDVMEQAISSGGYALFESVDRGAYIVIVADGSKIRAMSPIVTTGEITIVNLVLSSCESK